VAGRRPDAQDRLAGLSLADHPRRAHIGVEPGAAQENRPFPPFVSIDMPVIVDGKLYDLAYQQSPKAFSSIFAAQNIPPSWTASIVDRNASLVARSKDIDRFMGRKVSGELLAAMALGNEGVALSHTLDGTATLSAFSRSSTSGWSFIVGVPRTELSRANWSSVGWLTAASLLLLVIGAAVALVVSRDISASVRGLGPTPRPWRPARRSPWSRTASRRSPRCARPCTTPPPSCGPARPRSSAPTSASS
jgi:hypothetical protein